MLHLIRKKLGRSKGDSTTDWLVWAIVIFALATALRALWVVFVHAEPFDGRDMDDTQFYYGSALSLANGDGYTSPWTWMPTAQWPPGYSFLLSGLVRVFGEDMAVAWGANVVLGALTCVALYFLGRIIGGKKVGIAAGMLLAAFPGHIFFASLIMSETLFAFLVVVTLVLVVLAGRVSNAGPLRIILIGVLVGAAAMVRGQGLFLIFVAGLFWWLHTRDWARALQWATVVGLTAIVVVIPWSVRNYFAMNNFVLISTNDGGNLYMGNWEFASGGFQMYSGTWIIEQFDDLPYNEQEAKSSNAMLREGLRFMFTHPVKELQLSMSKVRYLYENDSEALAWIDAPEAGKAMENRDSWESIANLFYFGVLALSAGGVVQWWRQRRGEILLPLLMVAVFTLGQLLFFGIPRFHFPMLPAFALLAAFSLTLVDDLISGSRSRRRQSMSTPAGPPKPRQKELQKTKH